MFELTKIIDIKYLDIVKKYHMDWPQGVIDSHQLYNFFDDLLRLYKYLSYQDDDQSLSDQMIIKMMIEILDEYDFE